MSFAKGNAKGLLALLAVLMAACSGQGSGDARVRVGEQAPAFTLRSAQGETISLADYRGEKPVLLYFSMGPG